MKVTEITISAEDINKTKHLKGIKDKRKKFNGSKNVIKSTKKSKKKKGKNKIVLNPPPSTLQTICTTLRDMFQFNISVSEDTMDNAITNITDATCKRIAGGKKSKKKNKED